MMCGAKLFCPNFGGGDSAFYLMQIIRNLNYYVYDINILIISEVFP